MEMQKYKHVERLSSPEVEGLLDGPITWSPKLDGTNASLRWDTKNNCIAAFSRTRRLSAEKDNAGFYSWANSDYLEARLLRNFCFHNPNLILYGEFLGRTKFIGHIKDYNQDAFNALWLFDVYDTEKECYLPEGEWRHALDIAYSGSSYRDRPFPWYVPYYPMLEPTMELIEKVASTNKFLLDDSPTIGEGIVIRRLDFRNKWGNYEIGKYVRSEYQQSKSKPKQPPIAGEVEKSIVAEFVTDAEISKTLAKVLLMNDQNEFNPKDGKTIGMTLNLVFNDAILDEMKSILKKFKNPTINFRTLQNLCNQRTREYLGLC